MDKTIEVRVGLSKPYTSYVGASKEILKDAGNIELHALGEATSNAIRAAEMLCSLGYSTLERFETLTVSEPDKNGVTRSRSKVIVKLSKAPSFQKAYDSFKSSRKES